MEINLPWALVDAAQRRWVNEKMNMGQARPPSRPSPPVSRPFKPLMMRFS